MTTIKLKKNSTSGSAPSASDLAVGEVAVNTADGLIYTKHTDNSIKTIGGGQTNLITVTVAAVGGSNKFHLDGTSQQAITMAASGVYKFDQSDSSNANHPLRFSLTSNGTHGGGSAITTDFVAVGTAGSAGAYVTFTIQQDGANTYYYYCSNHSGMGGSIAKLGNPTAAEILTSIKTVDGTGSGLDADTLDGVEAAALLPLSGGTMTGNLALGDNVKATFGAGDLEIFHTGSASFINEQGTGSLNIKGTNLNLQNSSGEAYVSCISDSHVYLYHNGVWKLRTDATGTKVAGTVVADALDVNGTVQADQYDNDEALPDIRPSLLLDFANSKTLDPRITFTRGSTATYYDGVTTAKAEENLLSYSQDWTQSYWTKSGSAATGDSTVAPDGTTTADLITINNAGNYRGTKADPSATASTEYTGSIYIKKSNHDYVRFYVMSFSSGSYLNAFAQRILNLTNGATIGSDIGTCTTTDVGNGWYRVTLSGTTHSSANKIRFEVDFTDSTGNNAPSTSVANGQAIFLWGAQLEQRSAVTAYTPTTSAPIVKYQPVLQTAASGEARFDHSPTTGESKGLLIEEARTNLFTYSADYSHSNWAKNNVELDDNVIIAPDGTLTGGLLKENTASGDNQHNISQAPTVTTQHYTMSAYFKEPTIHSRRYVGFTMWGMAYAGFDIQAGTAFYYGSGLTSQTITDVGNGWYYCTATFLKTNTNAGAYILLLNAPSGNSGHDYEVDGTKKGMHIWGAQLEAGSFPTSYIPTSGSTATRAVDAAAITGSNFSNWYTQGGNTVYVEFERITDISPSSYERIFTLSDSSVSNRLFAYYDPVQSNSGYTTLKFNGSTISEYYLMSFGTSDVKLSTSFDYNSLVSYSNGSSNTEDTSIVLPEFNKLSIGSSHSGGTTLNSTIKKIAFYPKRLSNATLKAMTTE